MSTEFEGKNLTPFPFNHLVFADKLPLDLQLARYHLGFNDLDFGNERFLGAPKESKQ